MPRSACLWTGTAASWIDLSSAGSWESYAYATNGSQQVVYAHLGVARASVWSGTAASWVDLHAFLPPEFVRSYAQSISSDANNVYISGYGFNSLPGHGRYEALLWTRAIGPASCYANCDGSIGSPLLTANDFQCFIDKYAANDGYANCDGSTGTPALTANNFQCFINKYAGGCL